MSREMSTWLGVAALFGVIISFSLSLLFLTLSNRTLGTEFFIMGWIIFAMALLFSGKE
jgi:hypothetical protein